MAATDPADLFHNFGGNLWQQTWEGQWMAAYAKRQTFEQFWNSLQGMAGQSAMLASPYPYKSADEHWRAWRAAANRGQGPAKQPVTPPDWSGQWGGGGAGNVLLRDYYASLSAEYKPRYVMSIQAEIEGRHWWPADSCLPNATVAPGRSRSATSTSTGLSFWDGDELVIWTKNLHPNMRGHGEAEYSDKMEMIERYYKTGSNIVVDVTRYDPVAYAAPQHTVGVARVDQSSDAAAAAI
jgi:hypothetical protein